MPIPFLLAGLGVAAGVIGAGGHLSAKETNERAQRISEEAQDLYNAAKHSLELAQNKTEKALLKLGYEKKHVLDTSMNQFLSAYDKVKHIQMTESIGINEISKFTIDQQAAIELRQMTDIYSSSITSGATGAAAGAVVALAASGSLSVVTGGLATACTALMAGEVGAAAGIAGSALSFGAAMTPLAVVAAPVILFTGISASLKADENLEKANTMYAEAEEASEKMKISETLCNAIADKSDMFADLLVDLNKMFAECSGLLAGVVQKKEGRVFKRKLTSKDFTEDDLKLIAVTRALAGAVKSVIDTPILSQDGEISYESETVYDNTVERLSDFSQAVDEVKQIDYNVKPLEAKEAKAAASRSIASTEATVMGGARNVFAFVAGFITAAAYAEEIALKVTTGFDKVLFLDSFTANKIAIWLILCTSLIMLIGEFRGTKTEKMCGYASGSAISILYIQYCRTVEQLNHYIIFSVIAFVVLAIIYAFFEEKKDTWHFGLFFSLEALGMAMWPLGFLVYAFFAKLIGFSEGFCLVVTSILMVLFTVFGVVGTLEENE